MLANSLGSKSLRLLTCYILAVSAIFAPYDASALYDNTRSSYFNSSTNMCNTTDGGKYLAFDPYGNNADYLFDFSNPTCLTIAGGVGATTVAAWAAVKLACRAGATCVSNQAASAAEQTADNASAPVTPAPSPSWPIKLAIWTNACAARGVATSACCAIVDGGVSCSLGAIDVGLCCAGAAAFISAIAATMIALAVVHGKGNQAYANARICGHDWTSWEQQDSDGNQSDDGIWTKIKGPHQSCLRNLFLGETTSGVSGYCTQDSSKDITNKSYREYIYGGVEFEDGDSGSCNNPSTWSSDRKIEILGYDSNNQRYYMTGPGNAPVFACYRFLATAKTANGYDATEDQAAMQAAYDCCKTRSQTSICIENKGGSKDAGGTVTSETSYKNKFCKIGDKTCHVGDVDFEIYESTRQVNYVCAKTYSVCPYNHLLGGGTETKDEDEDGNINNYCQYLNHCSKLPLIPYVRTSSLTGSYIDSSCQDLKGDTQNVYSYNAELLPINTRGFTAPIVQCIKETMQNVFLNKAGNTKCINPDEYPDQNEECTSGETWQRGQELEGDSFFVKMQQNFQSLLKVIFSLSIMLYGAMILFAVPKTYVERKSIFPYILKLALVAYFTLGNAWQAVFVEDLLGASGYLAAITFRPNDETASTDKQDGCQFPRYNYADDDETTKYDNPAYPPGREYLEVWDVLDCKIALALGFGPEVSVPNLIFMILGGFLTAGYGLIFVIAAFSFAFFLIFVAIRALQFFLVAITAVVILMYVSVFIIPTSLFSKTHDIFTGWWKQILGFTLQPMILFAYLGVLIAIFDNIVIGSATFTPATVKINGVDTIDTYGRISPKTISCNNAAKNDSIYCIFRVADIKTFTGLEALGVGLPMLTSINTTKLTTLIQGALLMFIFSKFMDNINEMAAKLVGGKEISTKWADNFNPANMAMKAHKALGAVQKRGMNALRNSTRGAMEGVKGLGNALGNKGKRTGVAKDKEKALDHSGERTGITPKDHSSETDNIRPDQSEKKNTPVDTSETRNK